MYFVVSRIGLHFGTELSTGLVTRNRDSLAFKFSHTNVTWSISQNQYRVEIGVVMLVAITD
jgi:hypothetical protein